MRDRARLVTSIAYGMFNFDHSKGLCSSCTPTDVDKRNVIRLKQVFGRMGYEITTNGHGGPFGHAIWFTGGNLQQLHDTLVGKLN